MVEPLPASPHTASHLPLDPPLPPLETIDVATTTGTPAVSSSLLFRRLGAWLTEAGLVVASALVPFGLGVVTLNHPAQQVSLNPVLEHAQTALAKTLQLPKQQLRTTVSPPTNLLWSLALIAPWLVIGSQFYQLHKTGQTLPKRWFYLRVTPFNRALLSPRHLLIRELTRWGLPMMVAYGLGLLSGTGLIGFWLPGVIGLCLVLEGTTALLNRDRRAWHDQWAGTWVVDTHLQEIAQTYPVPVSDRLALTSPRLRPQLNGSSFEESLWPDALESETLNPETAFILTEATSGLTTLILAPKRRSLPGALPQWRPSPLWWGGMILGSLLVLAGTVAGTQVYRQRHQQQQQQYTEAQFLEATQILVATPADSSEQRSAILALARIQHPQTRIYLGDLLSQANDKAVLATLQQALVSQGLAALPVLLELNQSLSNDLATISDAAEKAPLLKRQQTVKRAIAKILTLHEGELRGISLNKADLSRVVDRQGPFRLRLVNLKVAGSEWRGAQLTQAYFQNTTFFDPGLDGKAGTYDDITSDLSGADLKEANLSQTQLQGAQLVNTSLLRSNLSHSHLRLATLNNSNLTTAQLMAVDAPNSRWLNAQLIGADLTRANFIRADFRGARLSRVEAADSQWRRANLENTHWLEANLSDADLRQVNLTGANLQGAKLKDANFSGATLVGASLRNADLSGVNFRQSNLTGVDFNGARFTDNPDTDNQSFITTLPPINDEQTLANVDFSRALNLDGQQLTYICAAGGIHPACP